MLLVALNDFDAVINGGNFVFVSLCSCVVALYFPINEWLGAPLGAVTCAFGGTVTWTGRDCCSPCAWFWENTACCGIMFRLSCVVAPGRRSAIGRRVSSRYRRRPTHEPTGRRSDGPIATGAAIVTPLSLFLSTRLHTHEQLRS